MIKCSVVISINIIVVGINKKVIAFTHCGNYFSEMDMLLAVTPPPEHYKSMHV